MIPILYEDQDIIVVRKPAGLESQQSRGFAPDMVSEIRRYLHNPQVIHNHPQEMAPSQPPYIGVIHRLDKPVEGVMVYALNQKSAGALSAALQAGKMKKSYLAVVCGKPVDNCGSYVDYLRHCKENNTSRIVDKSDRQAKKAALNYCVREVINNPQNGAEILSLIDIELLTGRHHQIRVQFAGHGTPLYGDSRYRDKLSTLSTDSSVDRKGEERSEMKGIKGGSDRGDGGKKPGKAPGRQALALCAYRLVFPHPVTGKEMEFTSLPVGGAFAWFQTLREDGR